MHKAYPLLTDLQLLDTIPGTKVFIRRSRTNGIYMCTYKKRGLLGRLNTTGSG